MGPKVATTQQNLLIIPPLLITIFAVGCSKERPDPRYPGIIVSHIDGHNSDTGCKANLLATTQSLKCESRSENAKQADGGAAIKWKFLGRHGTRDIYEFSLKAQTKDTTIETSRTIEYDGHNQVLVYEDQQVNISIEPGTLAMSTSQEARTKANE